MMPSSTATSPRCSIRSGKITLPCNTCVAIANCSFYVSSNRSARYPAWEKCYGLVIGSAFRRAIQIMVMLARPVGWGVHRSGQLFKRVPDVMLAARRGRLDGQHIARIGLQVERRIRAQHFAVEDGCYRLAHLRVLLRTN